MTTAMGNRGGKREPLRHESGAADAGNGGNRDAAAEVPEAGIDVSAGAGTKSDGRPAVTRGLTAVASSTRLRAAIWTRALRLAHRFRVIRTVDVVAACFPERDFKAALTAAQRAMRGMVKASLLRRYRTDRFQTVYGLTQHGARWLNDADIEASASVRRVSDMTNPEHRLWAQFLVLSAEARGLQAWTEAELMRSLNGKVKDGKAAAQGLLRVKVTTPRCTATKWLRPDAVFVESDGSTWVEVDRSARGSDRAADLRALVLSVGAELADGSPLRRVVLFTRTDRILRRVMAVLRQVVQQTRDSALVRGRRQLREGREDGLFEVWLTTDRKHRDGRVSLVDRLAGHVLVQSLPVWLPKVRLDGRGASSTAGWLSENYLPYRRPLCMPPWARPTSPLLGLPVEGRTREDSGPPSAAGVAESVQTETDAALKPSSVKFAPD
jgi:hypothetical protein